MGRTWSRALDIDVHFQDFESHGIDSDGTDPHWRQIAIAQVRAMVS